MNLFNLKKNYLDIKNPKIIRMIFVKFIKSYDIYSKSIKIEKTLFASKPFEIPKEINFNEACKLISYLSLKVQKTDNFELASIKNILRVGSLLKHYGFIRKNSKDYNYISDDYSHKIITPCKANESSVIKGIPETHGIVDLITYSDNQTLFKKCDMSTRYFNWYVENLEQKDIKLIIRKLQLSIQKDNQNF